MAHTFTSVHYHVVFNTKGRESWFDRECEQHIWAYLGGIARENDMRSITTRAMCSIRKTGDDPRRASVTP
jgi:hypothetical protein